MTRRSLGLFVWFLILSQHNVVMTTSAELSTNADCHGSRGCLKCDNLTSSPRCVKCVHLIVAGTRQCVDTCPSGYREEWSSLVTYMGRICTESGYLGLPGRTMAILVGAFCGAAACLCVLAAGCVYLRSHRLRQPCVATRGHANSIHDLDLDTPERREFLRHLAPLRADAPVFLAMLNDTRKQVRGAGEAAAEAYRPVLRDLVRVLTLLNRSVERILSPPGDWVTLLAWAERVLRRYKKQHPHQVAQAQLVSFLQVPIQTNYLPTHGTLPIHPPRSDHPAVPLSSFQPLNNNQLAASKLGGYTSHPMAHRKPSLIDADFNPSWEFQDHTVLAEWSASRDYLVEDDFITLGFRPQDEITTEL